MRRFEGSGDETARVQLGFGLRLRLAPLLRNGGTKESAHERQAHSQDASAVSRASLRSALAAPVAGCSSTASESGALPPDVKAIVFLQRTPRGDQGNVFDYTSYDAGGRLVDALAAVGGRHADDALPERPTTCAQTWRTDVAPASARARHPVVRHLLRRRAVVFSAQFGRRQYQLYSINARRDEPQAADRAAATTSSIRSTCRARRSCS